MQCSRSRVRFDYAKVCRPVRPAYAATETLSSFGPTRAFRLSGIYCASSSIENMGEPFVAPHRSIEFNRDPPA
jgi:hypothetical protein